MNLWDQESCADWHAALERYPVVIEGLGIPGLTDLDEWYRTRLPEVLAERSPPELLRDELVLVTRWKMQRGVWREPNWLRVQGNDAALVREVAAAAFAAVPDPRRPVELLCRLDGVGPATASAVLAAYAPAEYPFFDEPVAKQAPGLGPVAYSVPYYLRYAAALRARAGLLSAACPHTDWTAQDVGLALWAAAADQTAANGGKGRATHG
jgi:hypothetical protein